VTFPSNFGDWETSCGPIHKCKYTVLLSGRSRPGSLRRLRSHLQYGRHTLRRNRPLQPVRPVFPISWVERDYAIQFLMTQILLFFTQCPLQTAARVSRFLGAAGGALVYFLLALRVKCRAEAITQKLNEFACRMESQLFAGINFFYPAFEVALRGLRFCDQSNHESSPHYFASLRRFRAESVPSW
jgi:hypothetical protein